MCLLSSSLLLSSSAAWAQATPAFPRNETFKNGSASNFTFGGSARLTGTGGSGNDPVGQGYLRLTDAVTNQAGYAIDNIGFPAGAGFTISFEFFSYGRSTADGADGFSVFLVDADNQPSSGFRIGASGGSLGYAQKTVDPISSGVSRGYIGIGIDEFGNYSAGTEGRSGGSPVVDADGRVPNGVAIRGAGNGSSAADYPYLTGTTPGQLGFTLDVPTARAQAGSTDYRRAYIDVVPTTTGGTTTYRITVRIQYGNAVFTAIENFQVATPPQNLRLGFGGATGGSTNVHEIRNLNLVQVPFATSDVASTPYNQAVNVRVLDNDVAPGSSIDPASVDLDPNTSGQQTTLTVPGKGTFSVNALGVVSFTPAGAWAGTVTVPYTIQSILGAGYTSSPANISVTIQGADVATTVNGPTSAPAGSLITYTMRTSNAGGLPALNVVPKLQLPAGLPAGNVTAVGGSYDAGTGWVTFGPVASLLTTALPVDNVVSFRVPSSGPVTGLASAASSSVPDPQTANNTASVSTAVSAPLPVELTAFTAQAEGAGALLRWTTAQEKNNDRFEVERSTSGLSFERVGTVAGHGTSTSIHQYRFVDDGAARRGQLLYYRLRQVDTDGTSTYSEVRTVRFEGQPVAAVALYPNPAPERTTLDLTALPAGRYAVRILDVTGRVVRQLSADGGQRQALGLDTLTPGTYVVQIGAPGHPLTLPMVKW